MSNNEEFSGTLISYKERINMPFYNGKGSQEVVVEPRMDARFILSAVTTQAIEATAKTRKSLLQIFF
jgi:hypothetical protein